MGEGKLAAQVAHATLSAYEDAGPKPRKTWKGCGQKKVVLKATSESELFELADVAEREGLPHAVVRDAGHTQLDPGTVTALVDGPAEDERWTASPATAAFEGSGPDGSIGATQLDFE